MVVSLQPIRTSLIPFPVWWLGCLTVWFVFGQVILFLLYSPLTLFNHQIVPSKGWSHSKSVSAQTVYLA